MTPQTQHAHAGCPLWHSNSRPDYYRLGYYRLGYYYLPNHGHLALCNSSSDNTYTNAQASYNARLQVTRITQVTSAITLCLLGRLVTVSACHGILCCARLHFYSVHQFSAHQFSANPHASGKPGSKPGSDPVVDPVVDVVSVDVALVDGGFFVCQTGTPELFEREVG